MTSNIDRAARILYDYGVGDGDAGYYYAHRLADASVLADDLPAPDRQGRWKVTAASFGSVTTSPAGEVVLDAGNFRDMQLYLTPGKALDLARALEAAAAHAQKEETDE